MAVTNNQATTRRCNLLRLLDLHKIQSAQFVLNACAQCGTSAILRVLKVCESCHCVCVGDAATFNKLRVQLTAYTL